MVCKSSIQFSVDGQDCIPSLLFDLRPNNGGGNEDNGNFLQKIPCKHRYTQCPDPAADHHQPCLHWRLPPHRQVSVSLLWGHCSFLLGPGAHKLLFVPSKSLFPQSWVSSGGSVIGLMATSSKEGLCHTQVCCTQSPCPCGSPLLIHTSSGDTQTQFWLSLGGVSGFWCAQGLFEPSKYLWWV